MISIRTAYILAKNESRNIRQSVVALIQANIPTIVLDSGSTDGTIELAKEYGATVTNFNYINHYLAYNEITTWASADEIILILDADMVVKERLIEEIKQLFSQTNAPDVVLAPIQMYWEEKPLKYSSLCPPKPIAFHGGRRYFEPVGHSERLSQGTPQGVTKSYLIHNDCKQLEQVLQTQARYAKELVRRSMNGELTFRDKIRVCSPLFVLATPVYSYLFKFGFLDGKVGLIYAIDRLIAEAIAFRTALSPRVRAEIETDNDML